MEIDFKKILEKTKKGFAGAKRILWVIGKHAFITVLVLILLDVILGGLVFYKYMYLAQKKEIGVNNIPFQFKENVYQKVLDQWKERDQKFQEYIQEDYTSPF